MNVFGLGPVELLVILLVALLVFGPSRLAEFSAAAGRALAELRRTTSDLTRDLSLDFPHPPPDDHPPSNQEPERLLPDLQNETR